MNSLTIREMQEERRVFERVTASLPAVLVWLDESGEWCRTSVTILDISAGGVRLRAARPFTVGERLQVAFELPDGDGHADGRLEILACASVADGVVIRAAFTQLPPATMLRIAR